MASTTDLLRTVANLLATAGVGAYSETNVPDPSLPMVVMKKLPATPDRAICLNVVVNKDSVQNSAQVMVQIRCRGAANSPLDVDDIADACRAVLHDRQNIAFGTDGSAISQLRRLTTVQNGSDERERYERIDQYYGDASFSGTWTY